MSERPPREVVEDLLSRCAAEPIHRLGGIQPHGALLGWRSDSNELVIGSEAPSPWLPGSFEALAGSDAQTLLQSLSWRSDEQSAVGVEGTRLRGHLYDAGPLRILELEAREDQPRDAVAFLGRAGDRLRSAPTLEALAERVVGLARELLGFGRVMLYRFDESFDGEVVAEARGVEEFSSYFGLKFPASDIPVQARDLYRRNWVRAIADVDDPIVPLRRGSGYPLDSHPDLTMSGLRSVSPVHLEYLRNMGVQASMSMSVLEGDDLWGLIACHHGRRRVVSPEQRTLAELLARMMSMQVGQLLAQERRRRVEEVARHRRVIEDGAFRARHFEGAFREQSEALLGLTAARGAMVAVGPSISTMGSTPPPEALDAFANWVRTKAPASGFETSAIEELAPDLEGMSEAGAGVLAIPLSADRRDFIAWFRPELKESVRWAGNPDEKVREDEEGRLRPRASFESWMALREGRAKPWSEIDVQAARDFGFYIGEVLTRRLSTLRALNAEREKRARDLDSFAYLAAHDLREPIRGMDAYFTFALEAEASGDTAGLKVHLEKARGLLVDTDALLMALLEYARASSMKPRLRVTELQRHVDRVRAKVSGRMEAVGGQLVGPSAPISLLCDELVLQEILLNLVSNGLKYGGETPRVEVDWQPSEHADESCIITVRDWGIGIPEFGGDEIFKPFRRLHPKTDYGGGTGCGLAIVQALVDRHGGRVWFESKEGAGTTFFFSIGQPAEESPS